MPQADGPERATVAGKLPTCAVLVAAEVAAAPGPDGTKGTVCMSPADGEPLGWDSTPRALSIRRWNPQSIVVQTLVAVVVVTVAALLGWPFRVFQARNFIKTVNRSLPWNKKDIKKLQKLVIS